MKFSERLRELRERRGLSQARLADEIGCSKSAISMYENGTRTPDFELLETFADLFNVDIDYLLGRDDKSVYFIEPGVKELAEELYHDTDRRVVMDEVRKVKKEDLEFVRDFLERINSRN